MNNDSDPGSQPDLCKKPRRSDNFYVGINWMNTLKLFPSTLLCHRRNLCLLVGLSFGCAANAHVYVAPTEGPVAEIVLENDVVAPMDFIVYAQAETCRGRSYVQRPTDQRRTVKVRANVPTAFSVGHSIGLKDIPCSIIFRFTPEEDGRYLFLYKKVHSGGLIEGGKANCTLQVVQIQVEGVIEAQKVDQLSPKVPFFESGAWCEEKK